ncbi:L-threonine 3-dehydrogenase [Candidatus Aerophobetes bacterium]|uniref:L-threonine 3-dehydrogenase n=1 Tax=Aerophobetes bacterium TaxID=2030807 RepID=A0A497E3U3_UNCAE|nr:MAG: L-threonine 3-dehydrogenase [Candidatus Aerophobetes bacterium]
MKEKMLAAVFEGEGRLSLKEVPVPKIKRPDEVLLKVEAASICGTDVHILEIPPGHPANKGVILGHEYTGKVLKVGEDVRDLKEGDRVVVNPNLTCGACSYCRMGMPNMCENMTTLGIFIDGGFAGYNVAPAKALHKISPNLKPEIAVFAEPLSCVVNAVRRLKLQPGESVVVLGAGPIGLLFTQIFKASGAGKIIVSEVSDYRGSYAEESGATRLVNPLREDLEKVVKEETGIGSDIAVDAVGTLFKETMKVVRRGGRILLFGQNYQARAQIAQNDITRGELTVLGSYIARFTFPPTVKIIESKILKLEKLITHRFPLEEIHKGIEVMRDRRAIKVIIKP